MKDAPPAVQELFHKLWSDIQQTDRRIEAERAKDNPLAYKNSRTFPPGVSSKFLFYSVKGRGRVTRYCYAVNRNVAGFYLGWVEVETKTELKRTRWVSRRIRRRVQEITLARYRAHLARKGGEPR